MATVQTICARAATLLQLEEHRKHFLNPVRLALLLSKSNVLALSVVEQHCKLHGQLHDAMADVLLALIGAYFQESGGFVSIADLWYWLDTDLPPSKLFAPVAHMFFALDQLFRGGTLSIRVFAEHIYDGREILIVDF